MRHCRRATIAPGAGALSVARVQNVIDVVIVEAHHAPTCSQSIYKLSVREAVSVAEGLLKEHSRRPDGLVRATPEHSVQQTAQEPTLDSLGVARLKWRRSVETALPDAVEVIGYGQQGILGGEVLAIDPKAIHKAKRRLQTCLDPRPVCLNEL